MFIFHLIHKLETSNIIKQLKKQLNDHINQNGMHKSIEATIFVVKGLINSSFFMTAYFNTL